MSSIYNTGREYSNDELLAELGRWAKAAELCIPQVQQAINEVADWSSFQDIVSPPAVLVAQNFEIEVTVHPDSTDAAMWAALHDLQSHTGSRPRLPTLVYGDDEPTSIELFISSSRRGLVRRHGSSVREWGPTMFSNNSHATSAVSNLLPEIHAQFAALSLILDNFVADANPSLEHIDDTDAALAELAYSLTEMRRALSGPSSDEPPGDESPFWVDPEEIQS